MPFNKVSATQLDLVSSDLEAAGTSTRQLSLKAGGVTEAKLGFSWEVVEIAASAFSFDSTRSNYTLSTAASSNANVTDYATLLQNGLDNQTLVVTTAVANEFSLSGTTLSAHGDITASGATYKLRYIVGTASGAASASGNQVWLGTLPQQPLNAASDYFQDYSFDSKWTEWDVGGEMTLSEGEGQLVLTQSGGGGLSFTGVHQDAPSADFVVTALIEYEGLALDFTSIGVMVAEDLSSAPSTANFVNCVLRGATSVGLSYFMQGFPAYNSAASFSDTTEGGASNRAFLRLFVDQTGSNVQALLSQDGRTWAGFAQRTFASAGLASVDKVGLSMDNNGSGEDLVLKCRMFRVDETSDPYLPVGGWVGTSVPSTMRDREDVTVTPNTAVNIYGWNDRRVKLIKAQAFSYTTATVGNYTFALTKDPGGTADNMFSTASFDMTTLTNGVPQDITLTSTADDLIMEEDEVWQATFTSDDVGLDAAGVYFMLTWLVL